MPAIYFRNILATIRKHKYGLKISGGKDKIEHFDIFLYGWYLIMKPQARIVAFILQTANLAAIINEESN
jgi:hypothetical protein